MSRATIDGGPVKSRSQSRKQASRTISPVVLLLAVIAFALLGINHFLVSAAGCGLYDWLNLYVWS